MQKIRQSVLSKILIIPVIFALQGCIYLVVGGIGALGGYVVSPDTVEGLTEVDETALWDTSIEILSVMGSITESKEEGGVILAKVSGTVVTVSIIPMSEVSTKVRVKARKSMFPKISVAQEVYVKILSNVTEY